MPRQRFLLSLWSWYVNDAMATCYLMSVALPAHCSIILPGNVTPVWGLVNSQ